MLSLRMLSLDAFVEETIKDFLHELYLHGTGKEDLGLFPAYIRARWVSPIISSWTSSCMTCCSQRVVTTC